MPRFWRKIGVSIANWFRGALNDTEHFITTIWNSLAREVKVTLGLADFNIVAGFFRFKSSSLLMLTTNLLIIIAIALILWQRDQDPGPELGLSPGFGPDRGLPGGIPGRAGAPERYEHGAGAGGPSGGENAPNPPPYSPPRRQRHHARNHTTEEHTTRSTIHAFGNANSNSRTTGSASSSTDVIADGYATDKAVPNPKNDTSSEVGNSNPVVSVTQRTIISSSSSSSTKSVMGPRNAYNLLSDENK